MSSKVRIIVIVCIVAAAYYIAFFTLKFTLLENLMLSPVAYEISEYCVIVRGQAVTGPLIGVREGAECLSKAISLPHPENLNTTELEMTGKSIYSDILGYPDYYACDWLVYGKVTGVTDIFIETGSGIIPVFEADRVYPIMSISEFLSLEVIMFAFPPWGLLAALALYLWPVVVIILLLLKKGTGKRATT